jgi:hypothetical protein
MGQALKTHPAGGNPFELTFANLPAPNTERWTRIRKIFVVRAVGVGLLTFDQASRRYNLSFEEFAGWQKLATNSGTGADRSAMRRALRTHPLWIGTDISQAPPEGDTPESFQQELF